MTAPWKQISELIELRQRLFTAREWRVKPFRDEKILAGWNGLAISAFADGAKILRERRWLDAATRAADFLRRELWRGGRLARVWKDGAAGGAGYLDDYAFLAAGLLDLYEAGGRAEDFAWAEELVAVALDQFTADDGGFYFTARDAEPLIQRPRSAYDQMIPSGSGVLAATLLRLHGLTGEERFFGAAEKALALVAGAAAQNPFGFGQTLCAIDLHLEGLTEVVAGSDELARAAHRPFHPNRFVVPPGATVPRGLAALLAGKGPVNGKPAAYVCSKGTCSPPVVEPDALVDVLLSRSSWTSS